MIHQCYYCDQIFDTKEQLYNHLEDHAKTKSEQTIDGESSLDEDQIIEQFNDTKTGEPARMSKTSQRKKKKIQSS